MPLLFDIPFTTFQAAEQQTAVPAGCEPADSQDRESKANEDGQHGSGPSAQQLSAAGGIGNAAFSSVAEQREHFRSDWHRFNVKRSTAGQGHVTEAQFAALLQDNALEVGSISGSDSDPDEGTTTRERAADEPWPKRGGAHFLFGPVREVPLIQNEDGAPTMMSVRHAVWRAILPDKLAAEQSIENAMRQLQQLRSEGCNLVVFQRTPLDFAVTNVVIEPMAQLSSTSSTIDSPVFDEVLLHALSFIDRSPVPLSLIQILWAIILSSGGHFAAAVVEMRPPSKPRSFHELLHVLAHKTFHRYVVRAKAGGRQSSQDATGKYAKSAGSQIRRANEAALEREIQELLSSWAPQLNAVDLVFVYAPAVNGRAVFAGPRAPLNLGDPKVRKLPFVVRRPTLSEVKRVAQQLLQVVDLPVVHAPGDSSLLKRQAAASEPADTASEGRAGTPAMAPAMTPANAAAHSLNSSLVNAVSSCAKLGRATGETTQGEQPVGDGEHAEAGVEGLASHPIAVRDEGKDQGAVSKSKKKRLRAATKKQRQLQQGRAHMQQVGAEGGSSSSDEGQEPSTSAGKVAQAAAASKDKNKTVKSSEAAASSNGTQAAAAAGVDEIDAALAAIALMQAKPTGKGPSKRHSTEASRSKTPGNDAEQRRKVLAEAAEKRMQAIQAASTQQKLW